MKEILYPETHAYTDLFEEVRHFILLENELNHAINYHWSRWEWMFARHSFEDEILKYNVLYYKEDKLIGVLMVEDVSGLYYYVTNDLEVKKRMIEKTIAEQFQLMVEEQDHEMIELLGQNNFTPTDYQEHMLKLDSPIESTLPIGYSMHNLEESYDVSEHHSCLWKGFDHGAKIPFSAEHLVYRERQVTSPNFKKRYATVVTNQNKYVSYASIWYQKGTSTALIEPVATIPEERKKGLASNAIAACVKEAKKDGAKEIYVGSNQKFYYDLGFKLIMTSTVYTQIKGGN